MPKRKEATRELGTANLPKKKLKSGPDVYVPMLRWDDLNYDIIWAVFEHLPTLRQEAYRRVSSAWNSILQGHLSKSFVICLGNRDLAKWKLTFDLLQTPRGTRKAAREGRTRVVTDKTRCVIIDFANVKLTHYEGALRQSERWDYMRFGWSLYNTAPLEDLLQHYPQIQQIILYRAQVPPCDFPMPGSQYLTEVGLISPSFGPSSVSVMLYVSAFLAETMEEPKWTNRKEADGIRSWKTVCRKAVLSLREEGEDCWVPSWEQCMAFWPYPADQLHWLEDCLRSLPAKDPVFKYLKKHTHDAGTDYSEPTTLTFRGQKYPRSVLAFCARYLTTYRRHLNLPAPPHPLSWND